MENYIKQINELAEDNFLPLCKVMKIDDSEWWKTLIQEYGMEHIYNDLERAIKHKNFSFADNVFYYDTDVQEFFSFFDIIDLKRHFKI